MATTVISERKGSGAAPLAPGKVPARPGNAMAGSARLGAYTVSIAFAAAALYHFELSQLGPFQPAFTIPWWLLAALFCAGETFVFHLHVRRNAYSFSLSEIPLVIGLFFAAPATLLAAQMVGSLVALAVGRRQSPLKLAFNISSLALETAVGVLVFRAAVPASNVPTVAGWLGTLLATLLTAVLAYALIGVAISLSEDRLQMPAFKQELQTGLPVAVANTCVALLAVTVLLLDPKSSWLLVLPTAIVFLGYRAYTSERQKHHSLESLYETTHMLHELLQLESTIAALLKQARKMFRADVAEILLLPEGTARRASLSAIRGDEEAVLLQPVRPEPSQGIWARVVLEGKAQLLAKPIRPEALRTYFAERGIKDVMIGPLLGKNATIGTVMVANRLGDVGTFDEEDLKLFETLANHASVSIENARLVADLEHSLAHLTELNRLKDDFAATVSHELRTPLTAIQGYVKTLLRRGSSFDEVEQRSFLEAIARQSDRLRRLIEDVLEVSRIESGRGQARSSRVNLLEIASSVVEEARQSALGHSFTIDIPAELPAIYTDPGKVRQILSNLVDNAVKYSARGSRVTIAATRDARAEQERVVVRVKDEGEGVPEDLRERIFERFYQVNQSSTREAGGTGLGLYVCSRLAGVVGGRVCLESSGSNGSTFCLVLPADGAPASGGRSGEVLATSGAL